MAKKSSIFIKNACGNNLKNVYLEIPYDQFIVVTGVSGSGKSSLTMDTLYAEGQRRYVESLSAYARQFLMRMKKPEVDSIEGLCPAIAIEQRVGNKNARSTVGTLTEIYDYLRLLFARAGRTFSPISKLEVKKYAVSDLVAHVLTFEPGLKYQILCPLMPPKGETLPQHLDFLLQKGFSRLWSPEAGVKRLEEVQPEEASAYYLLIDRLVVVREDEEALKRLADSLQTAFDEGQGYCTLQMGSEPPQTFSRRMELDGILFEDLTPQLFNFNSSFGACPTCEGYGQTLGIEETKVIPDPNKSVFEEAVVCWKGEKLGQWRLDFLKKAHLFDFPVHRAYKDLNETEKAQLWEGNEHVEGIHAFFKELESQTYKVQNRVLLARYRGQTTCPDCKGARLRKAALYVRIGGKTIAELQNMPIDQLYAFLQNLELRPHEEKIARRLLIEIESRLRFMLEVGLSYLSLGRLSASLSGGEVQRIHLTRTLGSNLTSSIYILDEPSIGLHPRDTARLVGVLKALRDLGNTVVVVEHEEELIAQADYLVDVGPLAGRHGGQVVYAGPYDRIFEAAPESLTSQYMSGKMEIAVPSLRRSGKGFIRLNGARMHNLQDLSVQIPLQAMTVVTGVSGSGKTTLVRQILLPVLQSKLDKAENPALGAHYESLEGDWKTLSGIEFVNQQPIGKSSRSNPVTYVGAYEAIRQLYTNQPLAKVQGYKPKHFSFNVEGGRCETCKGEGEILVSMQFLADVRLTCEDCGGKRFQQEILDVRYRERSIYEVLNMTVDEAIEFFADQKDILAKLQPLADVGLGYVKLGQSSSTLSGGEAQRVKLASFLCGDHKNQKLFFVFDEPTTGLHFHDIRKLLDAFQALIEAGHTVLIIEHNMDVIKSADYLIDLGPEGGNQGGKLLYQGIPEGLCQIPQSYTGQFLQEKLKR